MQLQSNPLKEPSLILPDPRIAGVTLHKLLRSEYITGQLNSHIDQQMAHVCPDDILEVAYKTIDDMSPHPLEYILHFFCFTF